MAYAVLQLLQMYMQVLVVRHTTPIIALSSNCSSQVSADQYFFINEIVLILLVAVLRFSEIPIVTAILIV